MEYSSSPDGQKFKLPQETEYRAEFDRLQELVQVKRDQGYEIVVVMGIGFVGAGNAARGGGSVDKEKGQDRKIVSGGQKAGNTGDQAKTLF